MIHGKCKTSVEFSENTTGIAFAVSFNGFPIYLAVQSCCVAAVDDRVIQSFVLSYSTISIYGFYSKCVSVEHSGEP